MSLVRFVRCKHCGLPHEVLVQVCPFTGQPVVAASPTVEPSAPADPLLDLRVFDRYRIEDPIGMGGMGTVYRALDEELGRTVAVKVLLGFHLLEDRLVRRFTREVQAAGSVVHPNVVELFDAGTLGDGTPFLVMELVPGRSLDKRIDQGTMPVAEAIAVCDQLLAALDAAHTVGVVHRDIK